MGSDWIHHTTIRPRRKKSEGDLGNTEYKDEFQKAFDILFNECKIPTDILNEELDKNKLYNLNVNTDNQHDEIVKNSKYHVIFLRSKFLSNPKFKKQLIEYYNPIGFFIKGPTKTSDDCWNLEITKKLQTKHF